MESTLKQSSSFGRASAVDVSQLDKVNAIPNKTTDNVLMDGLSTEDQLYLNVLMEDDSSSDDDDGEKSRGSSIWSPMAQSPVMMNKRIKKLRPTYAVTLSLEDISYIRPSWGISKGVKTIEIDKGKKKAIETEKLAKKTKEKANDKANSTKEPPYRCFLALLVVLVIFLTLPTYLVARRRQQLKIESNKLQVSVASKTIEVYQPDHADLESILKVQFAQGIPLDLKPSECTCELYKSESSRYDPNQRDDEKTCFACLDWAVRANLRVFVHRRPEEDINCYDIKWQSYDTLTTPLVDCIVLGDDQWFGIGDIQSPNWPLNKLQFDWTPLVTNLSSESILNQIGTVNEDQLALGSSVEFLLLSTRGIKISDLRTDFDLSVKISPDPKTGTRTACISVSCTDKCTQTWSRTDHLERLRYQNNILEYSICSSRSLKSLIARQIDERTRTVIDVVRKLEPSETVSSLPVNSASSEKMIERESTPLLPSDSSRLGLEPTDNILGQHELPDGIGLIERTIFATSQEFLPVLDGQTLRQYVDSIVKLALKTSQILLIDTRWETYVGSMKLNTAMFPRAKLLFEILHNKGFKIVLTIKPFVDTGIGVSNINQLFESGRLYATSYGSETHKWKFEAKNSRSSKRAKEMLVRRNSLFSYVNQTIEVDDTAKFPYICNCKDSHEGHCAVLDLTQASNRAWLIANIKKSNLLISEADGIKIDGAHPNNFHWDSHYRAGVSELVKTLFYKEKLYVLPQYTGDFGYIELAPRSCDWNGLRSTVNSVLNLGMLGHSLIHPGSVWGDLNMFNSSQTDGPKSNTRINSIYGDAQAKEKSEEELMIRWLEVAIFLPILQFNNISPIERHNLQELVQNLMRVRKIHIVPELKRNLPFTPLISNSKAHPQNGTQQPLIRPVWFSSEKGGDTVIMEQFMVGSDILVAPIMSEGVRQRDIYLPSGFWHDELRQMNIRGGKWLRNYPVELNEIAWFTKARR